MKPFLDNRLADPVFMRKAMMPYNVWHLSAFDIRRNWQFIWLCTLILSFSYELPLIMATSMDRANPRLFDFVVLIGAITVLPRLPKASSLPVVFRIWTGLVATFAVCSVIWTVCWLPWEHGKYSLFYLFKYLEGLLAIYIVAKMPVSSCEKKMVYYLVMVGATFVTFYAIHERNSGNYIRQIAPGKEVILEEGTLNASLGSSYHLSMYSVLACVMTLAFSQSMRNPLFQLFLVGLGLFFAWPVMACGARTGLGAIAVSWVALYIFSDKSVGRRLILLFMGLLLMFLASFSERTIEGAAEKFWTLRRLIQKEEAKGTNTIGARATMSSYHPSQYKWQGLRVPFIGAGFYVAPHTEPDGSLLWRHGYGIHNSYLLPLEQGGIAAFILFIAFLVMAFKALRAMVHTQDKIDRAFALGVLSFLCSIIVVSWGGQVFWHGANTQNFNTYILVLIMLAIKSSEVGILRTCGVPLKGRVLL